MVLIKMTYNMTTLDNATNVLEIARGVNSITPTSGLFAGLMLLVIFMAIFIAGKSKYDTITVLVVDSFVVTTISIVFFLVELISWEILIVPIILLIVSIIAYLFSE